MRPRLILYFPQLNASYETDREEVVGGLSEACELNLRRYFGGPRIQSLSPVHFKLLFKPHEGYAIVDLFSQYGTSVNDQPLDPGMPRFLRNGDYITLGGHEEFVFAVIVDGPGAREIFADVQPAWPLASISRETVGLRYIHGLDQFVVDGVRVPHERLSPLEHNLLRYLYSRAGRVCSYDELAIQVWGYKRYDKIENNTIAKTVSNLRRKLDSLSDKSGERYIATVHGRGVKCLLLPE